MASVKRLKFYAIAVFFLWVKTYVLYKICFNIESTNVLQEFILMINPLSSSILILGLALFFREKHREVMLIGISFVASLVLYFNVLYFRFFSDFITWPVLFQTSNAQDIQGSMTELMGIADFLIFTDVIILLLLSVKGSIPLVVSKKSDKGFIFSLALLLFFANLALAQVERPQLLTRSFDRELLVKNIGMFNYHAYDLYLQSESKAQRVFADSSEIIEVKNYANAKYKRANPDFLGVAEGKNVIVLSLESLQSFVINNKVNGEEITPFLNDLIKESYYFDNFYHQTEQGKTSDSEFIVDNSMFGRDSGAVFFTHATNEYHALPEILGKNGIYTSVLHPNNKSFWNRDMMYQALGYDKFYDIDSFDVTEENSVGWGLKDVDFFEQSIDILKSQPEPYYSKLITLTNHFPFELEEEDRLIDEYDSNSRTLNRYFPTVRYMDRAIEVFFERLKEEGLYEQSIFILYGDHYGISANHNKAMAMYLNKSEITPYDTVQLQRVPLIIHVPGQTKHEVNHTVSGQIDLKPTIMHLLGLEPKQDIQFGTDVFSENRQSLAVLRDGSFITEDYVFTENTCYRKGSGLETDIAHCEPFLNKTMQDLDYSDKVLFGDLLRYYQEH